MENSRAPAARGGRNRNAQRGKPGAFSQQNRSNHSTAGSSEAPKMAPRVATPPLTEPVPLDTPRFADLAKENLLDPVVLKTIVEDMKFDHMTPVQAATLLPLLKERGTDILAQAKTGTGKTVAFLLPAIQSMLNRKPQPGQFVSLLVISPTRELALQIANEAQKILARRPEYSVCTAIGGTNQNTEERKIIKGCDILIGTPGRLLDHFTNNERNSQAIQAKMQRIDTLVLDEADRLLDMGFLTSLKNIISILPKREVSERQSMLFSATVPQYVDKVAHFALNKGYKYISTITEGELNTHERVPQNLIVVPTFSDMAAALAGALRQELAHVGPETFKAIVFAPTAALVDFYVEVLKSVSGLPTPTALHSRASQSKRTKTTDEFRKAKNGLLIATDVIARGMDFPAVTNVFQAGIPADKESYVHRLGRTARAGAEGRGTFLVTSAEAFFPKYTLKDIDFVESKPNLDARTDVQRIAQKLAPEVQNKAYQAWLGFYKTFMKSMRWDAETLVAEANKLALDGLGAPEVPTLYKSTVGKMGLRGTRGLVVGPDPMKAPRGGYGRGGGGAQGGGRGDQGGQGGWSSGGGGGGGGGGYGGESGRW
ncbi:atp-dependent rna helicase protein [Apiospora phragmitis]|uniref:ATP-dependent RNA helicase n=1 Tax=Apiospora phragmitis TaxID=2905665 RepID=A0ABR1VR01_9PEZI